MTLLADGFFDWAVRLPGPAHGVNGGRNGGKGMIPHSAVGNWDGPEDLLDFLTGRVNAPPGKRASWAATNMKGGIFYQHYSIWAQTWTSGAGYPNNNFFAFENEGGGYHANGTPNFSEPLTQKQIDNIIRAGRDLKAVQHWNPRRPINSADLDASLYEHNEMTRWGAAATACPSGRIPWDVIVPALREEVDMPLSDQDKRDIADIVRLEVTKSNNDQNGFINGRFIALIDWINKNVVVKLP